MRDAKQAEVLLNHQDNFLMKEEPTVRIELGNSDEVNGKMPQSRK